VTDIEALRALLKERDDAAWRAEQEAWDEAHYDKHGDWIYGSERTYGDVIAALHEIRNLIEGRGDGSGPHGAWAYVEGETPDQTDARIGALVDDLWMKDPRTHQLIETWGRTAVAEAERRYDLFNQRWAEALTTAGRAAISPEVQRAIRFDVGLEDELPGRATDNA